LLSTGGKLIRPRKHRASPQLSVADTKPREADTAALRHSCGAAGARGQPCTPGQRQGWERRHSAAICLVGEQGTSVVLAGGCCAMPTGVATVRAECMARMSITCHASSCSFLTDRQGRIPHRSVFTILSFPAEKKTDLLLWSLDISKEFYAHHHKLSALSPSVFSFRAFVSSLRSMP
jgi:hypothetical protein